MRLHPEKPRDELRVRPGRDDHHGRSDHRGARIPPLRTDQRQLPQVPADAKRSHPTKGRHHPRQHSRVHAGREGFLKIERFRRHHSVNRQSAYYKPSFKQELVHEVLSMVDVVHSRSVGNQQVVD